MTVQELKQNLYQFSGAKTYHQLAEMNSFLVDDNGKIRSYNEFKRKVDVVHKKYNRNYLQAEYQTAKRSAQASRQWKGYEKNADLFPNLKYMTVADDRVRHDHDKLHGIIKPVNDPFWNTHYPPNGWRCRCYVKPTTESVTTTKITTQPDKGFGLNVGKANKVFDSKHPYFSYPSGDEKTVQTSFEQFKLLASYGKARYTAKNGAKVFVSPFADSSDLFSNYRAAIKIADAGISVKIRPDINTNLIKGGTNPEYFINGVFSDRKAIKTIANFNSLFKSAKKQALNKIINPNGTQYSTVIDFDKIPKPNFDLLKKELSRNIHKNRGKSIKEVIVIYKTKAIRLTREEIEKRDYTKLLKIQ